MKKKLLSVVLITAFIISTFVGCGSADAKSSDSKEETVTASEQDENSDDKAEDKKEEKSKKKDDDSKSDDIIVAKSVDTSSKYAFEIKSAIIGTDRYDENVIVLAIGEFTNNSDDVMDFSSIVDVEVRQDGFELDRVYTYALSKLNYAEIKPGASIPIVLGYEILDTADVEIVCTDRTHYAKQVLFEKAYSIDELIDNTASLIDEYDEYISDEDNDSIEESL